MHHQVDFFFSAPAAVQMGKAGLQALAANEALHNHIPTRHLLLSGSYGSAADVTTLINQILK